MVGGGGAGKSSTVTFLVRKLQIALLNENHYTVPYRFGGQYFEIIRDVLLAKRTRSFSFDPICYAYKANHVITWHFNWLLSG